MKESKVPNQKKAAEPAALNSKRQDSTTWLSEENATLLQRWLAEQSSSTPDSVQADLLNDARFSLPDRQALMAQLGETVGNRYLNRLWAQEAANTPHTQQSPTNAIQTALPLPEADMPELAGVPSEARAGLLPPVQAYLAGPSNATGQAAVNAVVDFLQGQGTVQYTGQADIVQVEGRAPEFRRQGPSGRATDAFEGRLSGDESGCAFTYSTTPTPRYKVEIYPHALIGDSAEESLAYLMGVLVHEFVHVQQYRQEAQSGTIASGPEQEIQAWLWQAEHMTELGIPSRSAGSRQIAIKLDEYFPQLSPGMQGQLRQRVEAARERLNQPRSASP